jgi:glutamate carboxypeptidase
MNARRALSLLAAVLALLGARPAGSSTGGALSRTERRIAAAVDRGTPAALALLERAVNLNSGTMNFEGVRAVGRLLEPEFAALGFATLWVEGAAWGRAGHLIATRPGRGDGPRVLLIGHLDTVFERDSPFQRYERLTDSTARGPGVIDMKGGDVIMLLALRSLAEAGVLDRLALTVVLTGDEEKAGEPLALARRDLVAAADWADVAIGFEDGDGDPRHAVIARRGASGWRLRTSGRPAHSSLIFREEIGSGAIYEAARIMAAFHDSLAHEPYLTVNPGVILGGTTVTFDDQAGRGTAFGKNNVIAESTAVAGDLRALSIEQRERAKATMQRIVSASPPHAGAAIEFEDGYPPLAPGSGNQRLLKMVDRASRDLGLGAVEAVDPARAGAADISFTEGRVEMALDAMGLKGEGGHTVMETAILGVLPVQAKRVALVLARLALEQGWRRSK